MLNYISNSNQESNVNRSENTQKQTIFGQKHPNFACKSAESFANLSEHLGFKVKCRDPRCSIPCHRNFSQKLGACLAERLSQVASGREAAVTIHRGNLTPPDNSTVDDIRRLKRNFLQRIGRFRKKYNCVIEIHATLHITTTTKVHFDIVAYSDLPPLTLRNCIKESWSEQPQHLLTPPRLQLRRGNLDSTTFVDTTRYSLVEILDQSTLEAAAKYAAKADRPEREYLVLPVNRKSAGYLETTWSTSGFWGGDGGQESVWETLIARWKANGDLDNDRRQVEQLTEQRRFREMLPSEPSEMARRAVEISVESGLTLEVVRKQIDDISRSMICQTMPRIESDAQSVHLIAQRWNLNPDRVSHLLLPVNNLRKDWQGWLWLEGESER